MSEAAVRDDGEMAAVGRYPVGVGHSTSKLVRPVRVFLREANRCARKWKGVFAN
jgi:hypothetical protein